MGRKGWLVSIVLFSIEWTDLSRSPRLVEYHCFNVRCWYIDTGNKLVINKHISL
jgi:hypothetical protein